jgi:hypothetical protein
MNFDKINFLKKEPFYIFEIDNFLNNNLYLGLKDNFPLINKNMSLNDINALKITDFKNGKFGFDTSSDIYKEEIQKNIYMQQLHKIIFSKVFFNYFYKNLYFKFFRSRFSRFRHLIKLLKLPKIVEDINKKKFSYYFSIFNYIKIEMQYSYIFNNGRIVPHTDSGEKLLSLMLYFPDYEDVLDNYHQEEKSYGTVFWSSNQDNFMNQHQVGSSEEIFKQNNKPLLTSNFEGNKLVGFIKNSYSWHSVEPKNIHANYIRKSININFYF